MKRISVSVMGAVIVGLAAAAALTHGGDRPFDAAPAGAQVPAQSAADAAAARRKLTDDPRAPAIAPKGYDVTVVEYYDYQCPYCRTMHPVIERLLAQDRKVRVVYRVWPIFGPVSVAAAKAVLASQYQGKFKEFDHALWQVSGKLTDADIRLAAKRAGVDWARLKRDEQRHAKDIDGLLAQTERETAMMGLRGTPGLIIGPYMLFGALDYPTLTRAVALARKYPQGNAPTR